MNRSTTKSQVVAMISELMERWTGFALVETTPIRVLETFERRAEALGYTSTYEYLQGLRSQPLESLEVQRIINVITNGLTAFWRDEPQLSALRFILSHLATHKTTGEKITIWCAGVSTGEEAYTAAMIADEVGVDVQILGTDINTDFLATASAGIFSTWSLRRLSPKRRETYLQPLEDDRWRASHPAFESIAFRHHNLLSPPPHSQSFFGLWDIIMCRNVLIYFTPASTNQALRHMADSLSPEGYLLLGSSEQIHTEKLGPKAPQLRPIRQGGGFLYRPSTETGKTIQPGRWEEELPQPVPQLTSPSDLGLEETTSDAGESHTVATLLRQAWSHYRDGSLELALACLEASLGYDPFQVESHCLMGSMLSSLGAEQEALSAFQKALFLDPHHWFASFRVATLQKSRGDAEEARIAYRRTLKSLGRQNNPFHDQPLLKALIGSPENLEILARREAEDFLLSSAQKK